MTKPSPSAPPAWHALPVGEVGMRLGVDSRIGLSTAEAAVRLEHYGDNTLVEAQPVPIWRRIARQFAELVIWILIAAAVISAGMGEWADATAIAAIVIVNTLIGFFQEERAMQALAALRKLSSPQVRVMRDGRLVSIPVREVVPGDHIELEAGDYVPADARLVEAHALKAQEAALTGESLPLEKLVKATLAADTPLGDRRTMVYAGTVIAAGRGEAVVVATGMDTELGHIAGLLEQSPAEVTPLQRRLGELGRVLILVCFAIVAVIFTLEIRRGGSLWEVLMTSVSLAVAAVPEGLPAVVTLVLAIGLQRMVARNALVRRLPSVETLGSVTVVCSDKTGTLTRNEMTVRELHAGRQSWHITGTGYAPHGEFHDAGGGDATALSRDDIRHNADLQRLLTIATTCNNASVQPKGDGGQWQVVGDPTEGALVVAALKAGIERDEAAEHPLLEIPFDSERKTMSVVVGLPSGRRLMYSKGAPEAMLPKCATEQVKGEVAPLSDARRHEILATAADMAERALRVLALGWRDYGSHERDTGDSADQEHDLVFCGLAGMIDPPRDEAREAVARCRSAGIRPVMITGDHPATALAIARELGMADGTGRAATGTDLDALSDEELAASAHTISVYARVSAAHKLRVVQAWQARGEVVGMTGDGVNDAPAVKAADIGIAMGITGTDVTKEASDMVLTDDNFASIVNAVEEGRGIYDNIQKFIHYLLSCNAGEVLLMLVPALAGWPPPLAPMQILWLNLVTDGLPALALGLEPPEPDIMHRDPRPPKEPVITWSRGLTILFHGTLVAAVCLFAFWTSYQGVPANMPHARTFTFCVAAFAQLFFAIGCRSDRVTAFAQGFFTNPWLLGAILISSLLQVTVVMLPFAQPVFEVGSTLGRDWVTVILLALIPVTVIEIVKALCNLLGFRGTASSI
jgi:Ca2+-transporting ATPase